MMNKLNQKGFSLVEGLLIVVAVLLLGFGGYYVYNQNTNDEDTTQEQTINEESSENDSDASSNSNSDEGQTRTVQTSKLYPEVSVNAFEGWELVELTEYDHQASATLGLVKGNARTDMVFNVSADRGVQWPNCYVEDSDKSLGLDLPDKYADKGIFSRYESEGKYAYGFVDRNVGDNYDELIDMGGLNKDDVSFCATNGIIATVDSTKTVVELPYSHDANSNNLADSWLEGISTNTTNIDESSLEELDSMIGDLIADLLN